MNGPYALAIAAGMAATVNPCGFAMLPAYMSTFVGLEQRDSRFGALGRALMVSLALTSGFVLVFGLFGLIVTPLALRIEQYLPWVTIVLGIGLVGLGIALVRGSELLVKVPKLKWGGRDDALPSMFLFGVSYAVASLSCTIGPFLAVTTTTFRADSWIDGLGVFVAYGVGMGLVIAILTSAVALAQAGVVNRIRSLLPIMNRIAGGLLVVAGAYVAYYGWYELRVFDGDTDDPLVDRAIRLQTWLQNAIVPDDPASFAVAAIAILAAVVAITALVRRRSGVRTANVPDHRAQGGT